jgi:glycosyltransferase involved in cell wall biosynthesis
LSYITVAVNIALVTETYPPEVNGVAMTLQRLVSGIVGQGHAIQVVRPRQDEDVKATSVGSKETRLLVRSIALPYYADLRLGMPAIRQIRTAWTRHRPECVHIATEGPLGCAALWVARQLQIPVISSFHTNFHSYGAHYGLGMLRHLGFAYLRTFHNYTAATFAPTRAICDELSTQGIRHLRVMSRGVDCDLYDPAVSCAKLRHRWLGDSIAPVVLYVGRIAQEKNLKLAIRAFHEIQQINSAARFVLVGDGPMRRELEQEYPEFLFTGFQKGAALAQCYASADVFLFPSVTETFGNVLTEAMASGLACIAYDYAAAREYATDGKNALLAPLGDEACFLAAARRLAQDVSLREHLGQSARQLALRLNWDSVVRAYLEDVRAIVETEDYRVDAALPTFNTI